MNETDLEAMFGLSAKPKAPTKPPKDTGKLRSSIPKPFDMEIDMRANPFALELDRWDEQRGEEMLQKYPDLKRSKIGPDEAADFHAMMYLLEPTPTPKCLDTTRQEFIKGVMETADYAELQRTTQLNSLASEIAAEQVGLRYAKFLAEKAHTDLENEKRAKRGKEVPNDVKEAREAIQELAAIGEALKDAKEEVEALGEMQCALGCGMEEGDPGSDLEREQIAEMFHKVKNDPNLRAIMNAAGRYIRVAKSKQRQKVVQGYDDMIGVELSGDISRMIPSEAVRLMDEDFELDALRRIAENGVLSREYRGIEPVGKGPIIVCVDESGSMAGKKIHEAKGFALGMAWVARHQKRWVCLIGYSGSEQGNLLMIPPNQTKDTELMSWLVHFYGRGTHMDVPLVEMPTTYWNQMPVEAIRGKVDLILITDEICRVPKKMEEDFNAWKKRERVRCITLVIGGKGTGELGRVSDEIHCMEGFNIQEQGIQSCLGV